MTKNQFFIDATLKGAESVRRLLSISEEDFLSGVLPSKNCARDFVIYAAMANVQEAGMALIRAREILSGPDETPPTTSENLLAKRVTLSSLRAEHLLWMRKLTETLAYLLCFSQTNEDTYYRHFIYCRQLEDVELERKDLREYFGVENLRVSRAIENIKGRAEEDKQSLDPEKIWYASLPGMKMKSFKYVYNLALQHATPKQVSILKRTYYRSYSEYSGPMHSNLGRPGEFFDDAVLDSVFSGIGLISIHIWLVAYNLIGKSPESEFLVQVSKAIENVPEFEKSRKFNLGDFVIAGGFLGVIEEEVVSRFGYSAYKVGFLDDRFKGHDYFPDKAIRRYVDKELLKADIQKALASVGSTIDVDENLVVESVAELWNEGGWRESILTGNWQFALEKAADLLKKSQGE